MSFANAPSLHGTAATYETGLVDIAPGVCAWLQPNGDWSESNVGLVIGDRAAALIDTAWDLPLTRRILGAVQQRTAEPITKVIATHGDGDHVNGLQLLPQAELITSTGTAADMAHESPGGLRRSYLGARFLRTFAPGPPRRFGAYIASMMDPFDFRGITIRTPDRVFSSALTLDVGGVALELHHLGPAHTSGDTIVYVPERGVVFAGDLLFTGVTPNSWSGTVGGWLRAIDKIGALDPSVIVPGHGPLSGAPELELLEQYWRWLEQRTHQALDQGASVYECAREIVFGEEFAERPWGAWVCPERTVLNVEIVARSRATPFRPITHRQRPALMWQVARLHGELQAARA
ncbi:MAG: MBL fold metallo-hydrolase [Solirubrobacteraceae bacterium]|nr:MBL fold metallo-hydrolase [Solirubrobacteraceae bacterium]